MINGITMEQLSIWVNLQNKALFFQTNLRLAPEHALASHKSATTQQTLPAQLNPLTHGFLADWWSILNNWCSPGRNPAGLFPNPTHPLRLQK